MSETVIVACKLPNGMILQLWEMVEMVEPVMGGGLRKVNVARPHPDGRVYVLNGNRTPFGVQPDHEIRHGFGLTYNVDKEFFEKWLHDNRLSAVVKNGLVFAHEKREDVRAHAEEMSREKTQFEPLDPDNLAADPRVRAIGGGRGVIQKAANT
jgi:hypothetical protein